MRKEYRLVLLFLIFLTFLHPSCQNCIEGEGQLQNKNAQLAEFNEIEVNIPAQVHLKQGSEHKASFRTNKNLINIISFEVKRGKLTIDADPCIKSASEMNIYLSFKNLQAAEMNGTAALLSSDMIESKSLDLTMNGSGRADIRLNCTDLETEINGTSDVIFAGNCKNHEINLQGSGKINTYNMISEKADIELNGTGTAKLTAIKELDIEINGTGTVFYKGKPEKVNTQINGTGKVEPVENDK